MFNPITELCKFIDDIKTGESAKMQTFESSPYGTSYKFPDQKATLEDSLLLKINIKCWEGFSISEEEHKSFLELIPKAEYRNSWLYYLNERRIKSQFIMPINGFNTMSKLMLEFLDVISIDNDETSAKLAIILSQTFYYEKSGEKIFLHVMLVNHKIWFSETIWNNMIEDGIKKEMENYSQFCTDETSEEHKERMIAIIMSQLSSYIHIMKSFQLTSEFMVQIVTTLTSKYKMNLDMFLELIG